MSTCRPTWYVYYSKNLRLEWLSVKMRTLRLWRRFAPRHLDVRHFILIAILLLFIIATFKLFSSDAVSEEVVAKLEAGYDKIQASSECKSLLKKHLHKDTLQHLKYLKTPTHHSTLLDVVKSGFANLDSGIGVYAPDAEAYETFADLFNPIIKEYHKGFSEHDKHPQPDFGEYESLKNLDPDEKYIISTRIRGARSLKGYPFNPCLTQKQYTEIEDLMKEVFDGMSGELSGQYYPLMGMEKSTQQQLIDDHFLFKEGDRFLQAAAACRFWPVGRGIFHNAKKNFLVWVNEEDHLRIISMQKGGDLGEVYRRWVSAVKEIEKLLPFAHSPRLGFLTFCPTNLGTTVRASVHIKLPKLAANTEKLKEVAESYNLQVRGTAGEHTESVSGIYDISNVRRMGLTEFQAVQEMQNGILQLIKLEEAS